MVQKHKWAGRKVTTRFRAVLFRMVPKQAKYLRSKLYSFRAVLFRMVPKPLFPPDDYLPRFRAVLFRMVPKRRYGYWLG